MDEERINTDTVRLAEPTSFLILVRSVEEQWRAGLLIESLRAFGGRLSSYPVWVFLRDPASASCTRLGIEDEDVHSIPLVIEDEFRHYFFADKVHACAQAEEMAAQEGVRSLVWLSPNSLIVNPPVLFDLAPSFDAALRPVHIKNVGLLAGEPLDDFWKETYETVGISDTPLTVESFVDSHRLRPYYNTHLFSMNPSKGVLRTWLECFKTMVSNPGFQSGACRDEEHRIFLHQAILSALVTRLLDWERIRILPPEYSYPLHFHQQIPPTRRPQALNNLVCPVYEGAYRYPDTLNGIEVDEPLKSWLMKHAPTR